MIISSDKYIDYFNKSYLCYRFSKEYLKTNIYKINLFMHAVYLVGSEEIIKRGRNRLYMGYLFDRTRASWTNWL